MAVIRNINNYVSNDRFGINLMFALLMTVFPVSMPLLLRALFIVWLGIALRVCRQSGIK